MEGSHGQVFAATLRCDFYFQKAAIEWISYGCPNMGTYTQRIHNYTLVCICQKKKTAAKIANVNRANFSISYRFASWAPFFCVWLRACRAYIGMSDTEEESEIMKNTENMQLRTEVNNKNQQILHLWMPLITWVKQVKAVGSSP